MSSLHESSSKMCPFFSNAVGRLARSFWTLLLRARSYTDISVVVSFLFFFSSRRRHTRSLCDWSSDVCSSDLGTGVGGALILDGRLWTGHSGYAGEIGHMQIDPKGVPCGCGCVGCLETVVGIRSEERRVGKECRARGERWRERHKRGLNTAGSL